MKQMKVSVNIRYPRVLYRCRMTVGTSYNAYLQVQNELAKAFNEVRDDFASRILERFTTTWMKINKK